MSQRFSTICQRPKAQRLSGHFSVLALGLLTLAIPSAFAQTKATLTSPTPGSKLTGSSATFTWSAGTGASNYKLTLGTSAGGSDVYNSYTTAVTSKKVSGIPTNGATLYATLWSEIGTTWSSNAYTYTEYGTLTPTKATLTTPAPSSTLTGSSATFSWTAGSGVSNYKLTLGTTAGGSDVYNSYTTTVTSKGVSGIPTTGATLYATLWSEIGGAWSSNSYTYTEYKGSTPTAITPYILVAGGTWTVESSVTVNSTSTVVDLGPQPISGGSWSWSGPNSFTSTSREIDNIALSAGTNTYTATYTNASGAKSTQAFTITVASDLCPGTSITPYIAVNGGSMTQESSVTVSSSATVNLGPQAASGGSWNWSGPNGYTGTTQEVDSIPLIVGTDHYSVTYTNSNGCNSSQTFTIIVTTTQPTPVITWATPSPITYGTGLSSTQLNATANVAGAFTYLPDARAVLGAGTQLLNATFKPTNSSYATVTANNSLTITLPSISVDFATAPTICTAPTSMSLPSTSQVVGNGSADSCTESALHAAVASGGSITFSCGSSPVTIPITTPLKVNSATVIDGGSKVTLDGGGITRILDLPSFDTLSVRNLRFINGYAGEPPNGAAPGYLDSNFGNTSGGAIEGGYLSTLEVINCIFQDNTAFFSAGGAVTIGSMGTLTVVGSVFDGNKGGYGGAIYGIVTNVDVVNSIFTNNGIAYTSDKDTNAYPIFGGAINVDGDGAGSSNNAPPFLTICGSDFEDNTSPSSGGALSLWVYAPDVVTIDRSTFKNNSVWSDNGGGATGGAVNIGMGYSDTQGVVGTEIVENSTFISNTSAGGAGALGMFSDGGPASVTNCTFYENSAAGAGSDMTFGGWSSSKWQNPTPYLHANNDTFADGQGNTSGLSLGGSNYVVSNSVFLENGPQICSSTETGSNDLQYSPNGSTNDCFSNGILTANPELPNPASNGGPTLTMLPASGSPLIGAGTNCESTDQRGNSRNTSQCTIGSVEAK